MSLSLTIQELRIVSQYLDMRYSLEYIQKRIFSRHHIAGELGLIGCRSNLSCDNGRVKSFVSSPEDVAHVGAGDNLQTALIVGVYQRTPCVR